MYIAKLKELDAKASYGPWMNEDGVLSFPDWGPNEDTPVPLVNTDGTMCPSDLALIVALRNLCPEIIRVLDAVRIYHDHGDRCVCSICDSIHDFRERADEVLGCNP